MKINKHIAAAAAKSDNTHNVEVLQHIWNNRETADFFQVNVVSVAKSGASRKMQISIPYQGRILDITHMVGDVNENKVKEGLMLVHGGGMDMVFSVLYNLYRALAHKAVKEQTMRFKSVNTYKLAR